MRLLNNLLDPPFPQFKNKEQEPSGNNMEDALAMTGELTDPDFSSNILGSSVLVQFLARAWT